ncbi:MAG: hypothetical protein ACM3X5_00205, partial [Bacillota bacterium]
AGDMSELTAVGLALGIATKARFVGFEDFNNPQVRASAQSAVELLRPFMKQGDPSVRVRRAYGEVVTRLAFIQLQQGAETAAIASAEEARAAYRSIDGLKLDDLASAAGYAEASAREVESLMILGKLDEAYAIGQQGAQVASEILKRRPGYLAALRSHSLLLGVMAATDFQRLHMRKAIELTRVMNRDNQEILKIDPGNAVALANMAGGTSDLGDFFERTGHPLEGLQTRRVSLELYRKVRNVDSGLFAFYAFAAARLETDLGLRPLDYRKNFEVAATKSSGEFDRAWAQAAGGWADGRILLVAGDYAGALARLNEDAERLASFKPSQNGSELRWWDYLVFWVHHDATVASLSVKSYAAAEAHSRQAIEAAKRLPKAWLVTPVDMSEQRILHGLALSRMDRNADAWAIVESELKLQRDLKAAGSDDLSQHRVLALALLAAAACQPQQAPSLLREASAIMDGMPPEVRRLKTVMQLRGWIAEESARAGKA